MPQTYGKAEAVEGIAKTLIASHHPELATANFIYLFKEKAGKKGGKIVFGTVQKLSPKLKFLLDADFLLEVPLDVWNDLEASKRMALVDHFLECCTGEEDEQTSEMSWTTREPDVHEFSSILRRHGAWTEDLTGFVSVAQSVDLRFMLEEEESAETVVQTTASA
jgi:hypothetical protein